MSDGEPRTMHRLAPRVWLVAAGFACAAAGVAGGWWWANRTAVSTLSAQQRVAMETVVRDYILAHPEILPEAIERLRSRSASEQVNALRGPIENAFPGAVLGNPQGKVTLVEFTDYACGFCRQSVADVHALIDAHPDLKVVVRELPILSEASGVAARMALAAARQGRYAAFHDAMYAGGRPDPQTIESAARSAGLDMAKAKAFAQSAEAEAEVRKNMQLATQLQVQGTPAWVIGNQVMVGAVGRDQLERAITEARNPA